MSEESEKQFEPGEIVRLKSGGPMMTVGGKEGGSAGLRDRGYIICYWSVGVDAEAHPFPPEVLRRVDADEIEAERTVLFAAADKVEADAQRLELLFEELQSKVVPTVMPLLAEYLRDRAAAERARNQPAQLFNSFKDAFLGLNDEQRDILISNVIVHDPEAGKKFFDAVMATPEG